MKEIIADIYDIKVNNKSYIMSLIREGNKYIVKEGIIDYNKKWLLLDMLILSAVYDHPLKGFYTIYKENKDAIKINIK